MSCAIFCLSVLSCILPPPPQLLTLFFLMIRRPPRSTLDRSSAASDVYKRQAKKVADLNISDEQEHEIGAQVSQNIRQRYGVVQDLSLIHISEPTRPY